jgi:hypothetical protein
MDFPDISPQSINAISQRALLDYWRAVAKPRAFPSIDDFNPDERIHDPKQVIIWRLEEEGGKRRFRVLYQGGHVLDAFATPWSGKTMDEVIPKFARYFVTTSANECVRSGCALYSILRTRDANGHAIDCERLLLPLGRAVVEQIVASVQLVSPKGEFRRDSVVQNFETRMELAFAGRIKSTPSAG